MKNKYLVINAGSSSLKFSLYEMPSGNEIVNGYVEKIGKDDSFYTLKFAEQKLEKQKFIKDPSFSYHKICYNPNVRYFHFFQQHHFKGDFHETHLQNQHEFQILPEPQAFAAHGIARSPTDAFSRCRRGQSD